MSNLFITSAIRDIIPTFSEPYPKELVNYANYLYTSSKMILPLSPMEEAGRYHLCCYVTIEHFMEDHKLPEPFKNKIPIPSRKQNILVNQFRNLFNTVLTSTPRANRMNKEIFLQTPDTHDFQRSTSSFADKLKQSNISEKARVQRSLTDQLFKASLNPTENITLTPPSSPQKRSPKKLQGTKSGVKVQKMRSIVTTPILVSFCNEFYIPEHITKHIIHTFKLYRHIVNNSWGLLVGLVGISYLQLNKDEIMRKMNLRTILTERLHQLQQGGLSFIDVKTYLKEVTRLISKQKWIKEAKFNDYEIDGMLDNRELLDGDPLSSLGAFLDPSIEYLCSRNQERFDKWAKKMKKRVV